MGVKLREISQHELDVALDDSQDPWWLGNQVLYGVCQKYPDHVDQREVIAKVWLIGRAYSASVERGRTIDPKDSEGVTGFYEEVASLLCKSRLDERIADVRSKEGFGEGSIAEILSAHAFLIETLKNVNSREKRSFASKYLHFHIPAAFPIYDSIAVARIGEFVPPQRHRRFTRLGGDTYYRRFVVRVLALRDRIEEEFGSILSPRQLDRMLWGKGSRP